ncbi:MAG TPA: alginate export family protein, partial [Candidatus Hydrogenedentes bacterium]|nr:alginate export family protein [Candidatus Hydrogenedentota bacterium]
GLDDYGATRLHTLGTHLFGKSGGFDYSLELAYQFGDAEHLGATFLPVGGLYGDQNADYGNWGAELNVGYTFKDAKWQPRPYVMGVYFQGHDERDISFGEWLNPFYRPDASTSFNRLFSDLNYMPTINDNGWLSNVAQIQLGVELQATEKVRLHAHVAKDWAVAAFDPPVSWKFGDTYVPVAPMLSFWTEDGSNDLGWEVAAWLRYQYSADLWFLFYGNYLFAGDGLTRGAFSQFNGTEITAGTDDTNAGYVFWMAVLKF